MTDLKETTFKRLGNQTINIRKYTFCCSLPENTLSLMPTSNLLINSKIHLFYRIDIHLHFCHVYLKFLIRRVTLFSIDTKLFASNGIQIHQQMSISTILLYIRENKISITQDSCPVYSKVGLRLYGIRTHSEDKGIKLSKFINKCRCSKIFSPII